MALIGSSDGTRKPKCQIPRLIAFACVDGDVHEAIGHVNAALVAARVSSDYTQAEGFLIKRAELIWILRAYSDVSDLHSVRHKFLLSG